LYPSQWVNLVTPANARHPNAGNVDLDHVTTSTYLIGLKAPGRPCFGRHTINTYIVSILCNATHFKLQRRMPDPDGLRFRSVNPANRPAASRAEHGFPVGQN
jgi:hypothetical protein